jgi:hypothetical protein
LLQKWPADAALPPDLAIAKFDAVDAAVSYLVRSVCVLDVDGEVDPALVPGPPGLAVLRYAHA